MDFLKVLNEFNAPDEQIQKKGVEVKESEVTFVMTACGRVDLLEKTMDSFFKYNKYPIKKYIIAEDSNDVEVHQKCLELNERKYGGQLQFIFNSPKRGQASSIDNAYKEVDTKYVFHCEEDWEFYRSNFIEASIRVLEADESILQAWIRPKSDKILNNIEENGIELNGVKVRNVLPISFMVKGGGPNGSDLIVRDYMGFSWNPGLKRMSDYKLLQKGYFGAGAEHSVDAFYRAHKKGFRVVSIGPNDEYGYVKHIGWGRRAGDPRYGLDDKKKELGEAMKAAKQEQAQRQVAAKEEAAKKAEQIPVKQALQPLVSVVMQTYLGDYPGSRADSVKKFRRAVESFLLQDYKNCELIIVSDGCEITHREYNSLYADVRNIKYVYVDKNGLPNMYYESDGRKFYRGVPRRLGVSAASGDLITYMDSDDYLHPKFLSTIVYYHNLTPEADWMVNVAWYDHVNILKVPFAQIGDAIQPYSDSQIISVGKLNANFVETKVKDGMVVNTPWLLAHKSSCHIKWLDQFGTVSEDVDFARRLRAAYPNGMKYMQPTYFRCHYTGLWDI